MNRDELGGEGKSQLRAKSLSYFDFASKRVHRLKSDSLKNILSNENSDGNQTELNNKAKEKPDTSPEEEGKLINNCDYQNAMKMVEKQMADASPITSPSGCKENSVQCPTINIQQQSKGTLLASKMFFL